MTKVLLAGLYALRAQVDALVMATEEALGMSREAPVEAGSCPQCQAGPDDVINGDTLDGAKHRKCKLCGYEWEPPWSFETVTTGQV